MNSFLSYLLGGYIIWLFIAKAPDGTSWANKMGYLLINRDACKTGVATANATNTSNSSATNSASNSATNNGSTFSNLLQNYLNQSGSTQNTSQNSQSNLTVQFPGANNQSFGGTCTTDANGVKSCT